MTPQEDVITYEWPDIESFCTSEHVRLTKCFDANGNFTCGIEPMPHIGRKQARQRSPRNLASKPRLRAIADTTA